MCGQCDRSAGRSAALFSRRAFLHGAAGVAIGMAAAGRSLAAPPKAPAKPENVVSAEAALDRLMRGNERYVEGVSRRHDFRHEREALSKGQNPFAAILGCADSRVAPEYAFDTARGDLFVCRVAGNIANDDTVASLEYAVSVLNTPLILVLGHEACGAVDAALHSVRDGNILPGHLPSLVDAISPAVKAALGEPGDPLRNAIRQNVTLAAQRLGQATPILSQAADEKKIRIVGAIYRLGDGKVELLG